MNIARHGSQDVTRERYTKTKGKNKRGVRVWFLETEGFKAQIPY